MGIKKDHKKFLWRRENAISKQRKKRSAAAAEALTRDFIDEPSQYPNRKPHNIHCKIGQSCTAYTTWAQATQYCPTVHQENVNHTHENENYIP